MLLLMGLSPKPLGLGYSYGIHYEVERACDFYNIISFIKEDFTQCNLTPQIMAFG